MSDFSDFFSGVGDFLGFNGSSQPQVNLDQSNAGGAPPAAGGNNPVTTAGASAPPAAGSGGLWNLISGGNGLGGLIKNISPLVAAGVGVNGLIKGNGGVPNGGAQTAIAQQQAAAGAPLINAMNTGELPPGQEQQVDQQLQAQIAQIKAKYAQNGLSGSTMEQQDIQAAQNASTAQRASMAQQAVQTGISLLGGAQGGYNNLAVQQQALDKEEQEAISSLAAAFGGGSTKPDKDNQSGGLASLF